MSHPITVTVNNITLTAHQVAKKARITRSTAINRIKLFKAGRLDAKQLLNPDNINDSRNDWKAKFNYITIEQFRAKQAISEVMA